MATKTNASIVGGNETPIDGVGGDPNNVDETPGAINTGDIIESAPDSRDFASFPNLRESAGTASSRNPAGGSTTASGKRRGRPPGSGNKTTTAEKNLDGIEKLLLSIHTGLAMMTGCPEFVLDESEGKSMSDALQVWAKHHGRVIDPKTMATMNLIGTFAFIEGTRIYAIRTRLKEERKSLPKKQNVQEIRKPAPQAPTGTETGGVPPGANRPSDLNAAFYSMSPLVD